MRKSNIILFATLAVIAVSCSDDEPVPDGEENPTELSEEYYSGGKLGTTFNTSASAFEDPTPAVEAAGMIDRFKYGEMFFERVYNQSTKPFNGLGPLYVRSSCVACHPG